MQHSKVSKFFEDKKILVTGGSGFLGSHVVNKLLNLKLKEKNIFIPRSKDLDLRKKANCIKATKGVEIVFHLAGNVGGIGKNKKHPGTLFYDNLIMGVELLEAARKNKVSKIITVGTICAYPKYTPTPFKEEDLWNGYPEETNAPYGLAKKMLLVQSQAYRQEFNFNSIYLLSVNLYGPGDNFDPESSHVIPALIRKIYEAKENKLKAIELWGDGTPTREFLYVEDAAKGIILAAALYEKELPVNLGSGKDISIKDLALLISKMLNYRGEILWDTNKPNGQPKRLLDVTKAYQEFGFNAQTNFNIGLKKTISWFVKNKKQWLIT